MRAARTTERGFTLIELMVSLVLFSFAIAGVLAVAVSMSQGFRDQRQAVNAEAAVRIPLDFIVDAVRQASPGAPTGAITDAKVGVCNNTTVLKVTPNQTAANDATLTGWDQLELIYASGAFVTSTRTTFDSSSATIDVTDASQLAAGDYIVVSNTSIGTLVKITGIASNTLTIATLCGSPGIPAGGYSAGSIVVRAQHAVFFLDTVDGVPTLMMNPGGDATANHTAGVSEPLAEGIEDMQVALGVDTNADGVITEVGAAAGDDEWQGNVFGDANLVGTIRAVRITLISRTAGGIQGNATPFVRPAAEDHAAATTNDKYRRRILRSTVEVRNMGASP